METYRYPEGRGLDFELLTNITTSADGKFEVPRPGYMQLIVRKPGLAPVWRQLGSTETNNVPLVLSAPTLLASSLTSGDWMQNTV